MLGRGHGVGQVPNKWELLPHGRTCIVCNATSPCTRVHTHSRVCVSTVCVAWICAVLMSKHTNGTKFKVICFFHTADHESVFIYRLTSAFSWPRGIPPCRGATLRTPSMAGFWVVLMGHLIDITETQKEVKWGSEKQQSTRSNQDDFPFLWTAS